MFINSVRFVDEFTLCNATVIGMPIEQGIFTTVMIITSTGYT